MRARMRPLRRDRRRDIQVNGTTILIGSILLLIILMAVWARSRAGRIRSEAAARERRALAATRSGGELGDEADDAGAVPAKPAESTGETIFEPGTPTGVVPGSRGSIEVAEVLDIEELLRDEPHGVASRARAQLEEPTNIHTGDTLPPRPVVTPVAAVAAPPPVRAVAPPPPVRAVAPPPPVRAVAPPPPVRAVAPPSPVRAVPPPPPHPAPIAPPRQPAPPVKPAPAVPPSPPAARASALVKPSPAASPDGDVPLRELVLAWFEARGYRSSPASPVVRPIELVLRHKDDPSRAYAFVVGTQRVTAERVQQLAQQARGIGLIRVLIVADAGLSADAPHAKRGVRVLDRSALSAELAKLDISVAAKIIAVARKRSSTRVGVG